jgi:VanZ family protein
LRLYFYKPFQMKKEVYNIPVKKFRPAVIWFITVLVLIIIPGKNLPAPKLLLEMSFDKLVHMGMFGIMLILFYYPFSKQENTKSKKIKILLIIAVCTCLWSLCTELIQLAVPGRSCDMVDWLADSMGVLLAFIFCRFTMAK